ncbi:MAG: hypothetical protein CO002_02485 [Candidatus Portnoybacteria bacterium CG_4_8_14_3_um_filter_44_10]|uniref:Uncharacterized protein n=5 Tax=Candidatus Portnoyibacteriota TaxID=1817913 RepID=A0A2H0KQZ4_9BACT|nr:MAG: hypothetical protein COV85_01355 [Candidatus Portnoybacteria bacterium CG11_big_fil_rev_8_21_14_0_20_44_10]PIS17012.1 MAG: hypothetical protein COT61_00865 [Candidatus Portnoybacteria bacterium CG09_land_8_20_14_0_10_44_13]PIW75360.1 MAG: hypothetical protein CO002_02485 [Candidatus Portnoybacteria bacterium CG_4_8_14_3_um_filter_44_10]PIZ71310.1 MAG: hypothetical protein COY11_01540 [Candidatus Portnoybacteria bacterium CG_4_10_14_0_2_um_filter_44_20]PJA62838.1 MAG: hypothetical protei
MFVDTNTPSGWRIGQKKALDTFFLNSSPQNESLPHKFRRRSGRERVRCFISLLRHCVGGFLFVCRVVLSVLLFTLITEIFSLGMFVFFKNYDDAENHF